MSPFETRNEKPYWEMVVELIETYPVGHVFTYDFLVDYLNCEKVSNSQSAIHSANEATLRTCKRQLINVKNVGYRIATADEQIADSNKRYKRAMKQLNRRHTRLRFIRENEISPELRTYHRDLLQASASQLAMLGNVGVREAERAALKRMMEA